MTRPSTHARRWASLAWVLVLFASSLVATAARAANMPHHDLASLALMSDAIVLARRTGPPHSLGGGATRHVVTKPYLGPLAAGDTISVDYGAYQLTPLWSVGEDEWVVSDEVVLFLRQAAPEDRDRRPPWGLVMSGLRIFVGDDTYRFEQWRNPGPYNAVPQGRDPYDIMGDPRAGPAIDRATFERELARAIARATAVRAALADIDTEAGKRALVEHIGPAPGEDDTAPVPVGDPWQWQDRVAVTIIEALASTGDLDTTLDAIARVRGGMPHVGLRTSVEARRFAAVALDPATPFDRRLAALRVLHAFPFMDEGVEAVRIPLLSDPEPRIRAAVAAIRIDPRDTGPDLRHAIAGAFGTETDPKTRYALAQRADELGLLAGLDLGPTPIVWAERRRSVLDVGWFSTEPWTPSRLVIEARTRDGAVHERVLVPGDQAPTWSSGKANGLSASLWFESEPLPEHVGLTAVLTLDGPRGASDTRRLALRAFGAPRPAPARAGPTEPAAPPPADPPPTVEPPPPTGSPPGCACTAGRHATGWLWLIVLGMVTLAARAFCARSPVGRRTRSSTSWTHR